MYNVLTEDGLIITGAQGTGKSILAKIIAESRGEYITVSIDEFYSQRFSPDGIDEAATVIMEEFNPTPENIVLAKSLVTNQRLEVEFKMCSPFTIETPHFIFVADAPVSLSKDCRRFNVITMESHVR